MALTLPPGANLVKRAAAAFRAPVAIGSFALAAVLAAALIAVQLRTEQQRRMDGFGAGIALLAAQQALPHMLQQRRTELEALARRITALDEVAGCGFYTVDERALAVAGREWRTPGAPHYSRRVTVDETVAGRVRIVVEPAAFATGTLTLLAALWPLWLIAGAAAGAAGYARHERTQAHTEGKGRRRGKKGRAGGRERPAPEQAQEPKAQPAAAPDAKAQQVGPPESAAPQAPADSPEVTRPDAAEGDPALLTGDAAEALTKEERLHQGKAPLGGSASAPETARAPVAKKLDPSSANADPAFVVVANLFNHAELTQQTVAAELSAILRQARRVAKAWRGTAEMLPDAGVCIRFSADQVQGMHALRAALELAGRKPLPGSKALFRFALHRSGKAAPAEAANDAADAAQLSVLAPAGKVAVSEAAFAAVEHSARLNVRDVPAAALTALAAQALGRCRIVQAAKADAETPDAVSPAAPTE